MLGLGKQGLIGLSVHHISGYDFMTGLCSIFTKTSVRINKGYKILAVSRLHSSIPNKQKNNNADYSTDFSLNGSGRNE